MRYHMKAMRFMLGNLGNRATHSTRDTIALKLRNGGEIPADVYFPRGRPIGTILFVHGMAFRGARDPRVMSSCRNFCRVGFIVAAPQFDEIARLEIREYSMDKIQDSVHALCAMPEICPDGQVSLFVPSFSAAMGINVASRPETAPLIKAICSLGGPADMETTLEFFMSKKEADTYGLMISLYNFAHRALGNKKRIIQAFKFRAVDNSADPPPPTLPRHLETMSRRERVIFDRVLTDPEYRRKLLVKIIRKDKPVIDAFTPRLHLDGILAPITLIHGKDDNVIPAAESEQLRDELTRRGMPVYLEVTPLISHGDSQMTPAMLPRVFTLMAAFADFLRNAAANN